ncbi:hypothetical protein [Hyphococcus sp.]|jgi:hypothetical protein|uniref:hypothetical protein n=1 Tax=Hyphococcus sp. TaxID=2038636 RepID=UPI003D115262
MKKCYLSEHLIATKTQKVELTKTDFDVINEAFKTLNDILELEETFDILVRNLITFEKFCVGVAVEASVKNFMTDYRSSLGMQEANRHLLNLFTAARLYLDQMNSKRKRWFLTTSNSWQKIEQTRTEQYDNVLGYRFLEGLRNYAQHKGVPIHKFNYKANWLYGDDNKNNQAEYFVEPLGDLDIYSSGKIIKSDILLELREYLQDGFIDLRPFIRDYISGLGQIQSVVRDATLGMYEQSSATLSSAIDHWKAGQTGAFEPINLSAWEADERGHRISEPVFVNMSARDQIDKLQEANHNFSALRKKFASNAISLTMLAPYKR